MSTGGGQDDELTRLRRAVAGMRRALDSRSVIEQAIGVLAGAHGIDPDTAFEHLVRLSQHHNIKLTRMAVVLVELTAEAGPATAIAVIHRLESADPLIERALEANSARGADLARQLPGPVVAAARTLADAHDASILGDTATPDTAARDRLIAARTTLYTALIRLGWVPPLPVPEEIADFLGEDHPQA
ncbi:hypothetical protein GCM10010174_80450 [Kutzneria viridogrisea]|uniref:ANTAR domain-containing protein n=1 Tax=Kutzneria viridogrisea TaxID=47990 RepID=A0ABR6BZ32_9PSEU|nr:hypothetical protein [Kutzneria viridogrisea]